MKEAIYRNRYGDNIKFTDDEKGTIEMSGYMQAGVRMIGGNIVDGKIDDPDSVDPSGGPFLSKGDDLKYIFKDGKSRIIHQIQVDEKIILLYE